MGVYDHILVPLEGGETDAPCWSTSAGSPRPAAPRSRCCAWRTTTRATSAPASSRTPRRDLARAAELLRSRGITVRTVIVSGEPQQVIVQQAAKLQPGPDRHGHARARLGEAHGAGQRGRPRAAQQRRAAAAAQGRAAERLAVGPASRRSPSAPACPVYSRHARPPRPLRHRLHAHRRPRRRRARHPARHQGRLRGRGRARRLLVPRAHRPRHHPRPRGAVGRGRAGRSRGGPRPAERLGRRRLVDGSECIARYVELLRDEIAAARSRPCPASASWSRRSPPTAAPSSACSPATWRRGPVSSSSRRASTRSSRSAPTAPTRRCAPTCRPSPWPAPRRSTGRRYAGKDIVVIGDTPADVECGASLGVKAVAVATGRHSVDELAAHAPDHLFADFSDWRAAYDAIMG